MVIRQIGTVAALCGLAALAACSQGEPEKPKPKTTLSIAQTEDLSTRALAILNERCTVCHGAERFEARHFTAEEWRRVIDSMVAKGAKLSGDEMDVLRHFQEGQ